MRKRTGRDGQGGRLVSFVQSSYALIRAFGAVLLRTLSCRPLTHAVELSCNTAAQRSQTASTAGERGGRRALGEREGGGAARLRLDRTNRRDADI
jgi:hypothetical protein